MCRYKILGKYQCKMAQIKTQNISGKGNAGKYIDRFPRIYAAGIRSLQPDLQVVHCLKDGQHVVNPFQTKSAPFKRTKHVQSSGEKDMRNAGPFNEGSELINPPGKSKFQTLVEDLKSTVYKSYWNNEVGKGPDLASYLPPNLDFKNTTFGKKTERVDNLYDIIMPKCIAPVENVSSQSPGTQLKRNYCKPSYDPNKTYGKKNYADKNGKFVKCCLTDEKINKGTALRKPIITAQVNFENRHQPELGKCLTPNENINRVPKGHVFGKVEPKDNIVGCFTNCELNPDRELFKKCLAHLNTLRKFLSKRFHGSFFHEFYLQLKYLDTTMNGWLSKDIIYRLCATKYIRFNPSLIEPLLSMWKAINGSDIQYRTFINIINFREPLPWLPKVWDIPPECTEFSTTYMDMVRSHQYYNRIDMAGTPSGKYFDKDFPITPDGYCKADRSYLPHESDAKACLCPSVFTLLGISHRDMYTEREPEKVKKVFKAIEKDMDEDMFHAIWKDSTRYHPKGIVCYETFRRALNKYRKKREY